MPLVAVPLYAGDVCGDVAVREEVDVPRARSSRTCPRSAPLRTWCPLSGTRSGGGARKQLVGAIRGAFVLCVPPIQRLSRAVVHRRRVAEVVELVDDVPPEVVRHLRRVVAVGECETLRSCFWTYTKAPSCARGWRTSTRRRAYRGCRPRSRCPGGGHDVRAVPSVRYALPVMIGDGGEVARRGIRIRHRRDGVRTRAGIGGA